ncbi:HNH endonuclease family protein [Rhizobium ruizarguesonis]
MKKNLQNKILQEENSVDGIPKKIRLEVRDSPVFNKLVVELNGTVSENKFHNHIEPHWRYIQAVKIFNDAISLFTEEKVQSFIKFVSQNCIVIMLSTHSFADAFRLFSIVNDRGKQLRRIDILKAQNLTPEFIHSDSARSTLASRWQQYENDLGSDQFESVFYLARLIYVKEKPQADLLSEFEDRIFGAKLQRGQPFFDAVFKFSDLYERIFIDRDIADIEGQQNYRFKNLIYIMSSEFQASEWQACLLYFASRFGSENILSLLYKIEKVYLEQWFQGTRKDERFNKYAEILTVIQAASNSAEVIDKIKYDSESITNGIKVPNLYGVGYRKYVLLRLELLASEQDQIRYFDAKSIEHVLPQQPEKDGEWLKLHSADELQSYVNSLGNLVLISKAKNSSASNRGFKEKKDKYFSPRVSDYPRSNEILKVDVWTREVIEERTSDAAKVFLNDL